MSRTSPGLSGETRRAEQRGVRAASFVGLVSLVCAPLLGCTLLLQREHDQCQSSLDCRALAVDAVCTSDGTCRPIDAQAGVGRARSPLACQEDTDCADAHSVCRREACRSLTASGCVPLVPNDTAGGDRLPLAVLVPRAELMELEQGTVHGTLAAVFTVIADVERVRSELPQLPHVTAVACDEDARDALADVILDAEIRVVLGPSRSERVVTALSAIDDKAVLFAPSADAPSLDAIDLGTPSFLVSCKPNRRGFERQVAAAAAFVQSALVARGVDFGAEPAVLAMSDIEQMLGFDEPWTDAALELADLRKVHYFAGGRGEGLVFALRESGVAPRMLVAPSKEAGWAANLDAVDAASLGDGGFQPYYLLGEKEIDVLDTVTRNVSPESRQYGRVFGVDYHRNASHRQELASFAMALTERVGDAAAPGLDYVADCSYLAIYAAAAAQIRFALLARDLRPASLIAALSSFVGGPRTLGTSEIEAVVQVLEAGRALEASLDLSGAAGDLDFMNLPSVEDLVERPVSVYLHPAPGDAELYCIDAPKASFCDTGMLFPASGGAVTTEGGCPCFPP